MNRSKIGSLVLSGRAFSEAEVAQIQETVRVFSKLSRFELAQTLCEHLGWVSAKGAGKVDSCLNALRRLEALGLIQGPGKRRYGERKREPERGSEETEAAAAVVGRVEDFEPVELEAVEPRATAITLRSRDGRTIAIETSRFAPEDRNRLERTIARRVKEAAQ